MGFHQANHNLNKGKIQMEFLRKPDYNEWKYVILSNLSTWKWATRVQIRQIRLQ